MIGAITRIVGLLAVIVVLFHDGVALGLAQVSADQDAGVAARAAAQNWTQNEDPQKAYDAAALAVASNGSDVDAASFKVDVDLNTVSLRTSRTTSTILADRFSWFDNVTNPTSIGYATIEPR